MLVPCCKCMACRIARTSEWTTRVMHELIGKSGCFITLTYDEKNLPENGTLVKEHFQLFMKRLRRFVEPTKIKYYGCGEYGEKTNRPHYHAVIINWMPDREGLYRPSGKYYASRQLEKLWMFGNNTVGTITNDSVQYVCGYIRKKLYGPKYQDIYGGRLAPFQLQSMKLGYDYAVQHKDQILEKGITRDGKNVGIPRYYRKKLIEKDTVEEYYYHQKCKEARDKEQEPYLDENGIMREYYFDKASDRDRRRKALQKAEEIYVRSKM